MYVHCIFHAVTDAFDRLFDEYVKYCIVLMLFCMHSLNF